MKDRAHEQTFAYDIFSFPHTVKTGTPVLQQMHLSHKIQVEIIGFFLSSYTEFHIKMFVTGQ